MAGNMTGRLLNNRYQVTERIGVGGMAEVYQAQDTVLGRVVAVKVMLPQYAEDQTFTTRFKHEAAAAANLQSPYIVNVYDWGHDGETYYIVMEYVRGSDLKTAIQQRGAINQRKVAEIGSQVCQALSVAHNLDIIHRDIKPQNIMIQPDGNVKVMDFGIARAKNSLMAKTSSVLGTAHYISPEQAQGKELTPASDIYSLGVVLYESATGQLPFDGPDAVSVAMKQVQEQPVPPRQINPQIDPSLEAIIMKAMAKNPAERFSTALEMRRSLNDYLAGRPVNLGGAGFTSAETAVVPPMSNAPTQAFTPGSTSVMPAIDPTQTATKVSPNTPRNFSSANTAPKKNTKRNVIIALCLIAAIAIIAGIAFASANSGKQASVPDVTNMSLTDAQNAITSAGFQVGNVEYVYSESVDEDNVVSQDPKAGTSRTLGSKINLSVSQGTEQVTVPDLSGMTASEARQALTKLGLQYQAGDAVYSDSVAENQVAQQDPAAGTKVAKGTTVTYNLSAGKEGTTVPSVVGMSEATARSTLQNAGFSVQVEYQNSSSVSKGNVISQSPSGSSRAAKGATVTLQVSQGAKSYTVSVNAGDGGNVYPGSATVESGGSVTFTISPSSGYQVSTIRDTAGHTYSPSGNSVTVSNVTSDLSLTVLFTPTQSSSSNNSTGSNSGNGSNNGDSGNSGNSSNGGSSNGNSSTGGSGNSTANSTFSLSTRTVH